MSAVKHPFMGKVFVGHPVALGTQIEKYRSFIMKEEDIEMEFKGLRDGMLFTDRRIVVFNAQGITGRKIEFSSFPWRSVTAFSVENSGAVDLDAELKFCGSGWGVCEVMLTKGTNTAEVCQYLNGKIFAE